MPRNSLDAVVEERLAEGDADSERFVDLRVDIVRDDGRIVMACGGKWDRRDKRYCEIAPAMRLELRIQPAQYEAAAWFARWFRARRRDELLRNADGKPIFSVALVGGRRAGKSDLALRIAVAYAVDNPGAIVWIIAPAMPDTPELDRVLEELLPADWYQYLGDPWYLYTIANGSEIHVKSSHDPKKLKRGRVDVAVINEAQLHGRKTYNMVRPAIADRGGLVILAANPPDDAKGEWVEDYVERANAGRFGGAVFVLDASKNPTIVTEALTSLADEFDERTLARERDGQFGVPRGDNVWYNFSSTLNVERVPDGHGITYDFLRRKLNVESTTLHGMDFQKHPYQAASQIRFWEDPDDPLGDPLFWIFGETLIEHELEGALIRELVRRGFSGADTVIADASGDWQDSERTKGSASWDILRAAGWRKIFHPDAGAKVNPPIMERIRVGLSLIKSESGRRKLRVDPRCEMTIKSLRFWENRNGIPNRRSEWAHLADTYTYPAYRLFPRRSGNAGMEYASVVPERSARRRDLDEVF